MGKRLLQQNTKHTSVHKSEGGSCSVEKQCRFMKQFDGISVSDYQILTNFKVTF